MQSSTSLRIASGATLLLFAGHTAGGLNSWSPVGNTPVLDAMKSFRFPVNGFDRSYWHFYIGFGLNISVFLLAQAVVLWQLASLVTVDPVRTRPMILVFLIATLAAVVLDTKFFFAAPLALTVAIGIFLGAALLQTRSVR